MREEEVRKTDTNEKYCNMHYKIIVLKLNLCAVCGEETELTYCRVCA